MNAKFEKKFSLPVPGEGTAKNADFPSLSSKSENNENFKKSSEDSEEEADRLETYDELRRKGFSKKISPKNKKIFSQKLLFYLIIHGQPFNFKQLLNFDFF
jgi:hypothetical protein